MKHSLSSSEWTLLAVFLIFIATLVVVAKVNVIRASDVIAELPEPKKEILITIVGAVKKPGEYRVPEGTPLESAIKKAAPCPFADLKDLPLKETIDHPLQITIKELKEIRVNVFGAVSEPLELVVPVGSRICDLKSKIAFTKETDKSFFRRRKLLRDGDKIEVPKKTVEQN